MSIQAVLFDLDGTLLDTMPDFSGAINHALTVCGFPARRLEEFSHIIGGGIRQAIRLALPADAPAGAAEQVHEQYALYYGAHCCDRTQPYAGAREMLETLERRGLALAVLTNKTESLAQKIIAHYFPGVGFRFVWGNQEPRPLKPAPEAGRQALAQLCLDAAQAAYVGDSDTDIQFALASGMYAVGAVWGYRGYAELAGAGAQLLISRPDELAEKL